MWKNSVNTDTYTELKICADGKSALSSTQNCSLLYAHGRL